MATFRVFARRTDWVRLETTVEAPTKALAMLQANRLKEGVFEFVDSSTPDFEITDVVEQKPVGDTS